MKKLLLIALLIVGCDIPIWREDPPTAFHPEHYSCIQHSKYYPVNAVETGDSLYYDIDTVYMHFHASNINNAAFTCNILNSAYHPANTDTSWCECEAGILWQLTLCISINSI